MLNSVSGVSFDKEVPDIVFFENNIPKPKQHQQNYLLLRRLLHLLCQQMNLVMAMLNTQYPLNIYLPVYS
ncbi:hypothetical protein C7N43_00010 [Sphingobacteriales bacterium UPWRP_1]|nr:hypothetical protein C7N43_00010 [Sphingobacteriales bacterium UPWRP_1]